MFFKSCFNGRMFRGIYFIFVFSFVGNGGRVRDIKITKIKKHNILIYSRPSRQFLP